MTEAQRRDELAEAGHNLFRLPPARVRFDLVSDVPRVVLVPAAARSAGDADPDQIAAALAPLCGDDRLAIGTKGRAAELALAEALELDGAPVVLTHGLFGTTRAALARRSAVVESLALAQPSGSADVDLDALEARLARGGVALVYLELANNAWFGWPLSEANVAAVRAACDRHGARLVLDATRALSNSAALDAADLAVTARRILAHAHAYTIACAKELLVPIGSVVGSPDAALIGRAAQLLFQYGASLTAIDPQQLRVDLRDGARAVLDRPALVRERLARVRAIGAALRDRGVAVVEPITAHAVYVPLDAALLPAGDVAGMIALLGELYAISGARAQVTVTQRGPAIRLALQLCTPLDDDAIGELAGGVAAALPRLAARRALRFADGQTDVPYFRRLVAM